MCSYMHYICLHIPSVINTIFKHYYLASTEEKKIFLSSLRLMFKITLGAIIQHYFQNQ